MNKKIKVYSILLALVFVGSFVHMVYTEKDEIVSSFKQGAKDGGGNSSFFSSIPVMLEPMDGNQAVPVLHDQKTNKDLKTTDYTYKVRIEVPDGSIPTHYYIIEVVMSVFTVFFMIALLAFPFLFFNVIYNIGKNKMISDSTTFKLRVMGWTLIGWFILESVICYMDMSLAKQSLDINGFNITGESVSAYPLILGLIMLIITEVINYALKMKEEQDLTI
ncbi:DUF2975 domain-containing protein [Dysgonomonas sp. 511]|uniref:DUF2975 domain-containing protein n=1 Tax=Dysgonomonas sp. 511 TaxID=2302930 RepID=UPI0013D4DEF9|nr:DUF2975 domain-containing protein [Dysgonomonas sp. 511]NDV79645.1 DUF2975 domain-containing protein [Dysgonomonas sp. 511]